VAIVDVATQALSAAIKRKYFIEFPFESGSPQFALSKTCVSQKPRFWKASFIHIGHSVANGPHHASFKPENSRAVLKWRRAPPGGCVDA
jgi:hypothetical protein